MTKKKAINLTKKFFPDLTPASAYSFVGIDGLVCVSSEEHCFFLHKKTDISRLMLSCMLALNLKKDVSLQEKDTFICPICKEKKKISCRTIGGACSPCWAEYKA